MRNESFTCEACGAEVTRHPTWSARNHCPKCLCSLHVDDTFPGDRASDCHGIMRAIGFDEKRGKGVVLIHECSKCGKRITNIPAPDDDLAGFSRRLADDVLKKAPWRRYYE